LKNIQIIDGALNATFSVFQATEDEFAATVAVIERIPHRNARNELCH
jgi:hypothetical protein